MIIHLGLSSKRDFVRQLCESIHVPRIGLISTASSMRSAILHSQESPGTGGFESRWEILQCKITDFLSKFHIIIIS